MQTGKIEELKISYGLTDGSLPKHATIYVTRVDMSSAFDTIQRDQVNDIAKKILNEDEIRVESTYG